MPDLAQIKMFPTRLLLWPCDPAKNMRRFFYLTVQGDLFGGAALVREGGRIGSSGQGCFERFADEGLVVDDLSDAVKQKSRRCYAESPEGAPQ